MTSLALRIAAITALIFGLALDANGFMSPDKGWIDLLSRVVLWPVVAWILWVVGRLVLAREEGR